MSILTKKIITSLIIIDICIFSILGLQEALITHPSQIYAEEITQGYTAEYGTETIALSTSSEYIQEVFGEIYDYRQLQIDIEQILEHSDGIYAITVKDLSKDQGTVINGEKKMVPASLIKVPFAMLFLKDIEEGRFSFETEIELKEEYKAYSSDYLYSQPAGEFYSVENLLSRMLKFSDNTAMNMIYQTFYTTREINVRLLQDLGLTHTAHAPFTTSAIDMESVFENLYKSEYLKPAHSQFILDQLSDVPAGFNDRIAAGVPEGVRVAHKIGNLKGVYQDAGIVFTAERDYIIVVLANDVSYEGAQETISKISAKVWEFYHN